jgi:protocatechuate 3,4-dioxygenase beta subunit
MQSRVRDPQLRAAPPPNSVLKTRGTRLAEGSVKVKRMTGPKQHDEYDRGFAEDLSALAAFAAPRRTLLQWGLSVSVLPLVGCGAASGSNLETAAAGQGGVASSTARDVDACAMIPEETSGPFPGDGTNGANALVVAGIVRSDIRASVAGATGVAEGVPLTLTLTMVDTTKGRAPIAGHAVYIWHCDRDGNYSMYSQAVVDQNYLRGIQQTDANGQVTFTTTFPGCYSGRWPHIHFEVYPSLAKATSGADAVATSQLALPADVCSEVYATAGYEASVANFANMTLATDNVFSDGATLETPATTGDVHTGFVATLSVGL